jgi:hypothetical protein
MYEIQLNRIKKKLCEAREVDKKYKVFGASTHKYKIGPPVSIGDIDNFEKKYSITLPECYKSFLLTIGNGGGSYAGSAAGPFYGIYPLGKNVDEILDKPELFLKNSVQIRPKITDEEWAKLTEHLVNDDDISDDDYDKEMGKVFSGVLPIGSQGCSYLHAIVVSGEYSGRVVNIDLDLNKPKFCFEANFLDWYERWLDEIISGILLEEGPNWFGYTMGGDDKHLLEIYEKSEDIEEKLEALKGLTKLISASCESCRKLIKICEEENSELRHIAVRMLTKFSYATAIDILDKHIDGDDEDCLTACQSIFWYAKDKSIDWADRLKNRLAQVSSDETFRFITYILREVKIDYSENIKPFCTHENEEVRVTAFYSLGQLKNKSRFIDEFIVGLQDESPRVVHITLQALVGIKDKRLLDSYIKIIERFKADENYVLTNLDHRLKDMGYGNRSKFAKRFGIYGIDGLSKRNKSLADVFKKIFR